MFPLPLYLEQDWASSRSSTDVCGVDESVTEPMNSQVWEACWSNVQPGQQQAPAVQHPGTLSSVKEQVECGTAVLLCVFVEPGRLHLDLFNPQGIPTGIGLCRGKGALCKKRNKGPRPVLVNSSGSHTSGVKYSGPQGALFVLGAPSKSISEMKTEKLKTH